MTTTPAALVTGVDFVSLATTDLDRAREFYGTVLGLPFGKLWGEKNPRGAEFETGTVTLALIDSAGLGLEFRPNNHPLALHVEDVEAARAELESRGVEFKMDTLDSGVCLQAFFEDPDGNVLALHHRYAPKPG